MIGEIGGSAEEEAARFIADHVDRRSSDTSPVLQLPSARRWATPGRFSGSSGNALAKQEALDGSRRTVVNDPTLLGEAVSRLL